MLARICLANICLVGPFVALSLLIVMCVPGTGVADNASAMCINGFRSLPLNGVTLSEPGYQSHGLRVVDDGTVRSLFLRGVDGKEALGCQISLMQPEMPVQTDIRDLLASFLLAPAQGRSMVVGMRNMGLVKFLRNFTPAQFIDVVDNDPVMIAAADNYFSLRSDDRLTVRQDINLDYLLSRPRGTYDVVYMGQGFFDDNGVSHQGLSSSAREKHVLQAMRERLNEKGVLLVALSSQRREVERDIDSVVAVFPHVFVWENSASNRVWLAALKHRQIVNPLIFRERAKKLDQRANVGFSFTSFIDRMLAGEYRVLKI